MNNDNKTKINWYPGHMAKTKRLIKENINLIDVIYEVVDARMPFSSKIIDIDDFVFNKPLEARFSSIDFIISLVKLINIFESNLCSISIKITFLPIFS